MNLTKILLLCLDMDPLSVQGDQHTGAAHLYVKETLEALSENHIETVAITRLNDKRKPRVQRLSGSVQIVRIELGEPKIEPKEFFWGRDEKTYQLINDVLEEMHFIPNLVHSIYWYSGKVGLRFSEKFSVPHAYTIISLGKVKHQSLGTALTQHDIDREETEYELFQKSRLILSVCHQEKANLLELYPGVDEEKIAVIGRGVDPDLFSPCEMSNELFPEITKPYLFFAGRLIQSKGLSFLMNVYQRLLEVPMFVSPPQLIIAGGTPEEVKESQSRVLKTDLLVKAHGEGDICWLGMVNREYMPILYSNALLTCLPSIYDPAARVIIESMACGTPVIMTETGYSGEVVISGVNGYIAPFGDVVVWSSNIIAMIKNDSWRKKLAARAQPSVLPYFSLQEFKKRHMKAYHAIWIHDSGNLNFVNWGLSEIDKILPHWDVPSANPERISIKKVESWTKALQLDGTIKELPVENIASSRIFSLITSSKEFIIKQPKPKLSFYKMFYPTDPMNEVSYKPTQARWQAEQLFSKPPLFNNPIAVNDELNLIMSDKYKKTNIIWDVKQIEKLFDLVRQFQIEQSQRFEDVLKTWSPPLNQKPTWQFFFTYDQKLNELNAHFRKGIVWFTPAQVKIELQRCRSIFASECFPASKDLIEVLRRQNKKMLSSLENVNSETGIVWGECRPGHIIEKDGKFIGIDAETCCFGEPEIDYGNFLWWFLNLREGSLDQKKYLIMLDVIKNMPMKERSFTMAWIWLANFYWLWWDAARGRTDRRNNFIFLFYEFDNILKEIEP